MKLNYELTGKADFNLSEAFQKAFKNAFVTSTEFLFARCFENAPIAKTRKGAVNLRNALTWEYNPKRMEAIIGIPKGSECEKVAFYTEFGCFFNPNYQILTKNGNKKFKDLTLDDYVLTHNLNWKKIIKIHKVPKSDIEEQAFITIKNRRIITTLNHPFLVERDNKDIWIEAKDLKENDIVFEVKLHYNNTKNNRIKMSERMKNRIITKETKEKMSKHHWLKLENLINNEKNQKIKEEYRKKIGQKNNKNSLGKRWKLSGIKLENTRQAALNQLKNMTPEMHKKAGETLKKFYIKYPEKHPNYKLALRKKKDGGSKKQYIMYLLFKEKYEDAILEYPIKTKEGMKYADVAIPSIKLVIEYDGEYWHKNREEYDKKRQRVIENEGWKVIRFSNITDVKKYLGGNSL
jgi:very-short-patch-repair endonuclease